MKILYSILISSHVLVGMSEIKECQISCNGKSEFVSQSLAYNDEEIVTITLDGQPGLSFLMVPFSKECPIESTTTDMSAGTITLNSSAPMSENIVSYDSNIFRSSDLQEEDPEQSQDIPQNPETEKAIENFKTLLSEWREPAIGDYVAVIVAEDLKRYGKVAGKNAEGYYSVDLGKSLLSLKEDRLVPLSHPVNTIDYIDDNLGRLLDRVDIETLPRIARPHIYKADVESKQKQRKKFPQRVVEKPERRGSAVLVALNKQVVVEGIVHDIKFALSVLKKKQADQESEPEYSGSLYSIVYTNPDTNEEELGCFTIFRVRMERDLLDEESDET